MKKREYLVATPRWYSYGGMFESLYHSLNLAKHYQKKLVLLKPRVHLGSQYGGRSALNRELEHFVTKDADVVDDTRTFFVMLLSVWCSFSRWFRAYTRIGRIISRLPFMDKFMPFWIGYSGLTSGKALRDQLGIADSVDWGATLRHPVQVDLSPKQEQNAKSMLRELGLDQDVPFVCLYVRDAAFDQLREVGGANFPNADINRFTKTVLNMISLGYYVVRVGDPTMTPLNIHEKFIDYVHTPLYSELLDLYLYRHCQFWLGTMGGARMAPVFYNRPSVVVNAAGLPISGCCTQPNDLVIFKHVYSKRDGRFLSLKEQLLRIPELAIPETGAASNYLYVENTAEEINQAFLEWHADPNGEDLIWSHPLQAQYHDLRQKHAKEFFFDQKTNEWTLSTVEQYHHFRPRVGNQFLEETFEFGDYLSDLTKEFTC